MRHNMLDLLQDMFTPYQNLKSCQFTHESKCLRQRMHWKGFEVRKDGNLKIAGTSELV